MSLITTLLEWGIKAYWPKYAADAEKALRIYQKLGALDGGKLFERAGAVFKSEGLDISQILADGLDLRHIEDIQSALNELVLKPAGNGTLICDGVFDFSPKGAFRQAVMEFQRSANSPSMWTRSAAPRTARSSNASWPNAAPARPAARGARPDRLFVLSAN